MKKPYIVTGGLAPGEWEEDNCAICRAMAKAEREGREPTLKEINKAFRQAKKEGAYVGGPGFTDD